MNPTFNVIVHFATSTYERCVLRAASLEEAVKEARRYQGADAKFIAIDLPNGERTIVQPYANR